MGFGGSLRPRSQILQLLPDQNLGYLGLAGVTPSSLVTKRPGSLNFDLKESRMSNVLNYPNLDSNPGAATYQLCYPGQAGPQFFHP